MPGAVDPVRIGASAQALQQYVAHYRLERPHQGLGNKALTASTFESPKYGEVVCDERLAQSERRIRD